MGAKGRPGIFRAENLELSAQYGYISLAAELS
jgi:hypothetical protein